MRIILTTSTFLLIDFFAIGQSNKLDIHPEVGPSLISVHGEFDTKPKLEGGTLGVYLNYNINNIFSIKTGIANERKGFRDEFSATLANGKGKVVVRDGFNLDYLVIPILFRTNFGNKLRFFVNGGPYLGYLVNQQNSETSWYFSSGLSYTNKKTDLGVSTGIGCSYPINDLLSISFEARNNLGMVSLGNSWSKKLNSTNFIFGINYHLKDKNAKKANSKSI